MGEREQKKGKGEERTERGRGTMMSGLYSDGPLGEKPHPQVEGRVWQLCPAAGRDFNNKDALTGEKRPTLSVASIMPLHETLCE